MNAAARVEEFATRCGGEIARFHDAIPLRGALLACLEAIAAFQDAPRPASRSSGLLAMTRLASPNRLNNCASFFASPL